MSKHSQRRKKLRNPSPEAVSEFVRKRREQIEKQEAAKQHAAPPETEPAKHDPDAETLAAMDADEREEWAETGRKLYLRLRTLLLTDKGVMDESEALNSLEVTARFLTLVVNMGAEVLQTVDPGAVRRIVAADVPLTETMRLAFKAAGHNVDELTGPAQAEAQDASPQKRPRGARHPLMVLVGICVQAARLQHRLLAAMFPHTQNQQTLEEKNQRHEERQFGL